MDRDRECAEYVSARLPALHRAAYLLCGDAHRADDIVAGTVMELYRHWHRVRAADNVDAYVHRSLVRRFSQERRLRWARVLLTDRLPDRAAARPDSGVEDRQALRDALARLTTAQRTVLVLRYFCDLPVAEVAHILRCSEGNVKSHSSRGLAALREILGTGVAVEEADR
ncbi:SigE family RNA polymerase sigma factor [Virgisporangium ochraceum]|jgi:RNA polymerase sigma-70 factor (sigma-E family)|uniref:RNA polymerase sigma24 factor n=1 Tax=Virgisporangium ochraceum TaxID=65505 RepID=A0A8J3ZTG7_9ACTN|nr:SigE family RNA polymerase sigma factor [Virgisporangium ochraceum]GIJ68085.1 RNA polymerase sigma24 factor [Virgisporangium ochraceum]